MLQFPLNANVGQTFPAPIIAGKPAWWWDGDKWASIAPSGGGFTDAPSDGKLWGRENERWREGLPIRGGTLQGHLSLPEITATRGDGTGAVYLGDPAHFLYWDGATNYHLGSSGAVWTSGNFNPATKVYSDGRTTVFWDNAAHMYAQIDGGYNIMLANYSDLNAFYAWLANFLSVGAANNFSNAMRVLNGGVGDLSPQSSAGYWAERVHGAGFDSVTTSSSAIQANRRHVQFHIPNSGWITASATGWT
jgi:hypothetical protein